jgi:recombination protein RecR
MKFSSRVLSEAVNTFSRLPGIGKKTALRTMLYLAQNNKQLARDLVVALQEIIDKLGTCERCFNLSDGPVCDVCLDAHRDKSVICVVGGARDVMAIEETGQFRGLYHVLGGVISPIDGIGPEELYIDNLLARVEDEEVSEIIMAINPTIEGETTIYYLTKLLREKNVRISVLARGISFGGELEYADELTLGKSILARTTYSISED